MRGLASGGQLSGSEGTSVRGSQGNYNVTIDVGALNAGDVGSPDTLLTENCAFTATSRNRLAMMTIDGPFAATPNTVVVTATFPTDRPGIMTSIDSQFDIVASC